MAKSINLELGKPTREEKVPTSRDEDKNFYATGCTVVFNEKGKDIDETKVSATKEPVENPNANDIGTSVVSIKAESNQKDQGMEI